ncbi:MAG: PRC-barrel [Verrucomicrobia bacterium]|jgi:sporulation protein YlmC with PRC-barrel domain|nr:PRC-barrel [Verrucomicrobiota bacterium]
MRKIKRMKRFIQTASFVILLLSADALQAESRNVLATKGQPQRATDVIGMEVRNLADEKLGKVEDVIVNLGAGRASYVILSTGGVFGLGDKLIVVPTERFDYRTDEKKLRLDADKDLLKGAPAYEKNKLPDWGDDRWSIKLDEYYVKSTNSRPGVVDGKDSSTRNERVEKAESAEGQGSSDKDILMTKSIRKQLVDSKLSTVAKNVQVITRNGHVTLRGHVKTEAEREEVVARAKQIAGTTQVTDKIEIAK